ncbi:MAG TPA: hypothetical protein VFK04_03080 [Gemmatimonadaceae bacterium]|jgi:hypothetical protein|nr:hypothetical protein [Gemmatimonadaceae bacterium]
MTFDSRIGPNGREDDITNALRRLYAAPVDEDYWSDLAQRIMTRITNESEGDVWWQPLARLARVGVLAAGVALAIASIALTRNRTADPSLAYETLTDTPRTSLLQIAIEPDVNTEREATLRYVIAP